MTLHKPTNTGRYLALLLLTLAVLFWGYSFISTKLLLLAGLPPATIAFYRQIISVLTLVPAVAVSMVRARFTQLAGVTWRDAWLVATAGLLGIVLYFILENNGIRLSTASNAAMIVSAVPIFTLFSEALFFKLKVTARLVACLIVSIAGVYLVVTGGARQELPGGYLFGNILVVGAMVCWVGYTILNKRLADKYSSLLLTFIQGMASIFLLVPFVAPEIGQWRRLAPEPFWHLLYLGVCCSALGYIFYIHALRRLGATVSAAFLNLVPVVTVVCGHFVLGERVVWPQLAGMLLIMSSLYAIGGPMWRRRRGVGAETPAGGVEITG